MWNYRLICQEDDGDKCYSIAEVYYRKPGETISGWCFAPSPMGATIKDVAADHKWQRKAFDKPVLDVVIKNGKQRLVERKKRREE